VAPSDVSPAPQVDGPSVRMIPAELRSRIQCLNSDYLVFLPEEHDGSKLKVYPDEGHGAGRAVVAEQGFYDWLF